MIATTGFADPDSVTEGVAFTDTETERAVLHAATYGGRLSEVLARANEEMFLYPAHRSVFRAVKELAADGCGERIDATAVKNKLAELGEPGVDAAGILAALDVASLVTSYDRHLETLRGRYVARKACARLEEAAVALGRGANPQVTIGGLLKALDGLLEAGAGRGSTLADAKRAARELANGGAGRVMTGVPELDAALGGGLGPGELFVVGGRPGGGKSALGESIARAAAAQGVASLFVSMEMADHELGRRALASEPGLSMDTAARPDAALSERQRAVVERALADGRDELVQTRYCTSVEAIEAEVARELGRAGRGVAVIDYLQLADRPAGRMTEAEALGRVTRAMKQLARRLGVSVVLLSQLSRNNAAERREPELSDLRGSGCIEQDADEVLLLSRATDGRGERAEGGEYVVTFNLAKNRQGRPARFERVFDPAHMVFGEVARETAEDWARSEGR